MGTDVVNVRMAMDAAKAVEAKKLSFVAGFCWRYEPARREFYKRIHDGALGEIRHVHATYLTGPVKPMPPATARPAGMSDVEWQIRNWYNFVWLSGDGLVEQACHSVDKILWTMKDAPPLKCTGTGGRVNPNNEGNILDHIDVFYEWPGGMRATMAQRQIPGCPFNENADYVAGEKGYGVIAGKPTIKGAVDWTYNGPGGNMYQIEHDEFFASIRSGKPINDSHRMGISTLAGIMGRMAAYTGAEVTWEQVMASTDDIFPKDLKWDGNLPIPPMAVPGKTKIG
jgi:predicted dehydrogenase